MDFKMLVYKIKVKYLFFKWRNLPDDKKDIDFCREVIEILDPRLYADHQWKVHSSRHLMAIYGNLDKYVNALRECRLALEAKRMIQTDRLYPSYVEVTTMGSFFTSSDRFYLDVPATLVQFRKEALRYCTELEAIKGSKHGIDEYHDRILTRLTINLQKITKQLVELSV